MKINSTNKFLDESSFNYGNFQIIFFIYAFLRKRKISKVCEIRNTMFPISRR